jgi:hypothetical protein
MRQGRRQAQTEGGDHTSEEAKSKVSGDTIDNGRSREQTAKLIGTSPRKFSKIRAINDYDERTLITETESTMIQAPHPETNLQI